MLVKLYALAFIFSKVFEGLLDHGEDLLPGDGLFGPGVVVAPVLNALVVDAKVGICKKNMTCTYRIHPKKVDLLTFA